MNRHSEKSTRKVSVSLREFQARIKRADLNAFFIFGSIVLVLILGLYAIFFPSGRNSMRGNPACRNIVIAADGPSLSARVSPTLARAEYLLVVNPLSKELLEAARNPYAGLQAPPGPDVAYFVAGKGEEAVIATSIEPGCYSLLTNFGIRCYGGYTGKAADVVELYRRARIAQIRQGNTAASLVSNNPASTAAFGRWIFPFHCPRCYWRTTAGGNPGVNPVCPYCGIQMIRSDIYPAGLSQPSQAPAVQQVVQCPACGWRWYCQTLAGQFPRCPNCRAILATGATSAPVSQSPSQQAGAMLSLAAAGRTQAPAIYPDAVMPHAYRGVCSNCHQIIRYTRRNAATRDAPLSQAALARQYNTGRTCILR